MYIWNWLLTQIWWSVEWLHSLPSTMDWPYILIRYGRECRGHHDTSVFVLSFPYTKVQATGRLTRKKSSLGLVGPHLPHSSALCRSSGLISSPCFLAVFADSFSPVACPPYSFFHASPGARVGSWASTAERLRVLAHSLWTLSEIMAGSLVDESSLGCVNVVVQRGVGRVGTA